MCDGIHSAGQQVGILVLTTRPSQSGVIDYAELCKLFAFYDHFLYRGGAALAQDITVYPCDGCTADKMEKVAASKGFGIRYVYNLSAGLIVGYQVSREDLNAGAWSLVADPFEPESWIIDQYLGFNEFYANNGGSLHGVLSAAVASDQGGSVGAIDVITSGVDRNRVSDKLGDT